VAQRALGRRKEVPPGAGQRDAPGGAIEEPQPEGVFQFGHLLAHGLWRDAQPLGSTAEAVQVADHDEGFELAQRESGQGHGRLSSCACRLR
jgi:hypothetical protein